MLRFTNCRVAFSESGSAFHHKLSIIPMGDSVSLVGRPPPLMRGIGRIECEEEKIIFGAEILQLFSGTQAQNNKLEAKKDV